MKKTPHQAMVLLLCRSADGVSFDSVKNALRVPVLSLRYERYSLCAPRGIVSALQRYSVSDIISFSDQNHTYWQPKPHILKVKTTFYNTNLANSKNSCNFAPIKNETLHPTSPPAAMD